MSKTRELFLLLLLLAAGALQAQRQSFAFNRISTDDGNGLMTNRIYSLCQDEKGFIWLGTANGLQRFDGGKFVRFDPQGTKGAPLPTVAMEQILPAGRGRLWIAAKSIRQFGIFDFSTFSFQLVPLETSGPIPARAEFQLWQDSLGHTFLNVNRYGKVLVYDSLRKAFTEETPLNKLPANWHVLKHIHYDHPRRQYWITCDSGIAVYDMQQQAMWTRHHNPRRIPLLDDPRYRQTVSEIYIDRQRRHWIFYWTGQQHFQCFDSTYRPLSQDTAGLNNVNTSYAELQHFRETSGGTLWIYGLGNLYARDPDSKRFRLYRSQYIDNFGIRYDHVYDLMEDRDGLVWIATNEGLYYTYSAEKRVANVYLSQVPGYYEVTDLIELRNKDYWISTWGRGVITLNNSFSPYPSPLYRSMPPLDEVARIAYNQVWAMCQDSATGLVYLGCQRGQLMIHDPATGKTQYLWPDAFDQKTIRHINTDKKGRTWFGTQGGRLVRYDGKTFQPMADFGQGAIIYKVFIDKDGWIWATTLDQGLYAIDPETGAEKMHLLPGKGNESLFAATCHDMEQLNDSLLFVANAALSIVNKYTGQVTNLTVFDGLPSNSVKKIRLDRRGFLWLITDNGLCRYDHERKLFTTYGKKDGILLANRDLHDDMGSTLSTINILSAMAKTKLPTDPDKTSEYLGKISDNSQRMMEAMDDIVWAIKPDNDSMQKIVARMRECATQLLEPNDVDIRFQASDSINEIKLNMEQRRDLFLFFKEAVNNIAKYANAATATIDLSIQQGQLALRIGDDGVGFQVQEANAGNGLGNMQKRADALKGIFRVESTPGAGTSVLLQFPIH